MKEVKITIVLTTPPVNATDGQIQEWAEYSTGYRADISTSNPLCIYSFVAEEVTVEDY